MRRWLQKQRRLSNVLISISFQANVTEQFMVRPRAKSDVFGDSSKLPELLFEISELQGSSLRPLRRLARVKPAP
jgi:hypothetical protein